MLAHRPSGASGANGCLKPLACTRRQPWLELNLTWFSTTHLRPCSHSTRGGPAAAAALPLPPPAAAAAVPAAAAAEGAAGTAPPRSGRFLVFMSSAHNVQGSRQQSADMAGIIQVGLDWQLSGRFLVFMSSAQRA